MPLSQPRGSCDQPSHGLGRRAGPGLALGEREPGGGGRAGEAAPRLCPGGAGTRMERRRPQPAWGDSPAALGPDGAAGRVAGPSAWDRETGPVPGNRAL